MAETYLAYADACLDQASRAVHPHDRAALMIMAKAWTDLSSTALPPDDRTSVDQRSPERDSHRAQAATDDWHSIGAIARRVTATSPTGFVLPSVHNGECHGR